MSSTTTIKEVADVLSAMHPDLIENSCVRIIGFEYITSIEVSILRNPITIFLIPVVVLSSKTFSRYLFGVEDQLMRPCLIFVKSILFAKESEDLLAELCIVIIDTTSQSKELSSLIQSVKTKSQVLFIQINESCLVHW